MKHAIRVFFRGGRTCFAMFKNNGKEWAEITRPTHCYEAEEAERLFEMVKQNDKVKKVRYRREGVMRYSIKLEEAELWVNKLNQTGDGVDLVNYPVYHLSSNVGEHIERIMNEYQLKVYLIPEIMETDERNEDERPTP